MIKLNLSAKCINYSADDDDDHRKRATFLSCMCVNPSQQKKNVDSAFYNKTVN